MQRHESGGNGVQEAVIPTAEPETGPVAIPRRDPRVQRARRIPPLDGDSHTTIVMGNIGETTMTQAESGIRAGNSNGDGGIVTLPVILLPNEGGVQPTEIGGEREIAHTIIVPWCIEAKSFKDDKVKLEQLSHERPGAKVVMQINSGGGNAFAAIELAQTMGQADLELETVVPFEAKSSAVLLLSAGDYGRRYIHEGSRLMMHHLSFPIEGMNTLERIDELLETHKAEEDWFFRSLSERCHLSTDELRELFRRDRYFTPEEAVEWGIADHIIPRRKTIRAAQRNS